ncbi:MAG TPA: bpX6 domain-containing protein, partial [Thermoanaerobaculia bacterium]|nr:bpX6 domain-containing protein [Thermoanaerobaculia bacterium]
MSRVIPRLSVHRGVVAASGFLVESGLAGDFLLDQREARRRILALWTPGTRVYRLPEGWLVLLPRPVAVDCGLAPGLPLVESKTSDGRVLLALPLSAAELASVAAGDGAVVRLRGGRLAVDRPSPAQSEDPASWLGVEGFGVVETAPLGELPAEPQVQEDTAPGFDPRAHLPGVPPADPRLRDVLAALGKTKPAGTAAGRRRPRTSRGGAVAHWLHGVGSTLWGLLRKQAPAGPGEPREPVPDGLAAPSVAGRIADALHRVASRMVLASRLSRLVGRRHAAYIQRMMEMFERGDVQEALRLAIPLGGPTGDALRGLPLRRPPRRRDLRIRPQETRTWAVVGLAPDLFTELQRLYRETFRRLESQERIEEAAFLLAEVLHANEEAVAFLERHGRLRLAAEMAEARGLPPGLVVRQWFLAGDRKRALRIARRTGAFADAVTRLERGRQPGEARELRLLWAEALAQGGDFAAAVEVVWPLSDARDLALAWMDRAIGQGGPSAGRMLARKLAAVPEQFEKIRDQVIEMLESWRAEGAAARLAFADTLRQGPRTPEAMTLARAAVRAIARDSGRLGARMPPAEFRQLVHFAGDGSLRADAP